MDGLAGQVDSSPPLAHAPGTRDASPVDDGATVTGSRPWWRLPEDRGQLRRRAVRDGLVVAGWMTSAFILIVIPYVGRSLGYDAYSYWFDDLAARYELAEQGIYQLGAFRYAPPIGLLFTPYGLVPWWVYLTLWSALALGTVAWLGGRWALALLALPPVALELYHGNVHLLMAAAIALGFRYPAAWGFVLLTKVSPGIGLLWFAVRREWRALAIALGFTAAVSGVSFIVTPGLWPQWFDTIAAGLRQPADLSIPPPLIVRLPLAALLVVWGARTDRAWTVAVAATLALPNLWPHGLVVALAAVPMLRRGERRLPVKPESMSSYAVTAAVAVLIGVAAIVIAGPWVEDVISAASSAIVPAP